MSIQRAPHIEALRQLAQRRLPRLVFDYIDGGAEDETGLARNREAFQDMQLLPRYLVDVSQRDQSTPLLGRRYAAPFGLGPTGLAGFARPGADLMLADAAVAANIPFVLSGAGTASIEAVAQRAPQHAWYQLYVSRNAPITADLVRRARDAGIKTLMLTVDVPVHGKRERDIHNGFVPPVKPTAAALLNMLAHPGWLMDVLRHGLPRFENWAPYAGAGASARAVGEFFASQIPFTQTWRDLDTLRQQWPGKLVIKGILHPADALRALESGADGIVVSNHGGRQLDSAPSSLAVFPAIRAAVGERLALMLDGGVRRGSDIVKAKALGADFVWVGRAPLYGVAAGGLAGAQRAIDILQEEIDLTMAQIGVAHVADLGADSLYPGSHQGIQMR